MEQVLYGPPTCTYGPHIPYVEKVLYDPPHMYVWLPTSTIWFFQASFERVNYVS